MASEDEMLKQRVLKRIDREEKELQSLNDALIYKKYNDIQYSETIQKIAAIEELLNKDKRWVNMQFPPNILKKVPSDIRQLRDFLMYERELKNKYYYFVEDFDTEPDNYENKNDTTLFRDETTGMLMTTRFDPPEEAYLGNLKPLGHFNSWTIDPEHSYDFNFYDPYTKRRDKRIAISAKHLKDFGLHHLVYTELPPAAGSVPLNYDDYIESMRMNDLDGGRNKTRNRKNKKSKKTRKHKRRRGKR